MVRTTADQIIEITPQLVKATDFIRRKKKGQIRCKCPDKVRITYPNCTPWLFVVLGENSSYFKFSLGAFPLSLSLQNVEDSLAKNSGFDELIDLYYSYIKYCP